MEWGAGRRLGWWEVTHEATEKTHQHTLHTSQMPSRTYRSSREKLFKRNIDLWFVVKSRVYAIHISWQGVPKRNWESCVRGVYRLRIGLCVCVCNVCAFCVCTWQNDDSGGGRARHLITLIIILGMILFLFLCFAILLLSVCLDRPLLASKKKPAASSIGTLVYSWRAGIEVSSITCRNDHLHSLKKKVQIWFLSVIHSLHVNEPSYATTLLASASSQNNLTLCQA